MRLVVRWGVRRPMVPWTLRVSMWETGMEVMFWKVSWATGHGIRYDISIETCPIGNVGDEDVRPLSVPVADIRIFDWLRSKQVVTLRQPHQHSPQHHYQGATNQQEQGFWTTLHHNAHCLPRGGTTEKTSARRRVVIVSGTPGFYVGWESLCVI